MIKIGYSTKFRAVAAFALLSVLAACAGTATSVPGPSSINLREATVIPGSCTRLVFGNEDLTRECDGKALLSSTTDGQVQIVASMKRGTAVMFAGPDLPNPDANSDLFAVNRIIINSPALSGGPRTDQATGSCSYTNPYIAPLKIVCSAKTAELAFQFNFTASGVMKQ